MKKLVLTCIGIDYWSRPVYKSEEGILFKDINCGNGEPILCTVCGGFDGEPDTPIRAIKDYHGVPIEIVGHHKKPMQEGKRRSS